MKESKEKTIHSSSSYENYTGTKLNGSKDSIPFLLSAFGAHSEVSPRNRGITKPLTWILASSKRETNVVEMDKQPIELFLEAHPDFADGDKREHIRDGSLNMVHHAGIQSNEKSKEIYAFLFTDLIVFTKKRKSKRPDEGQFPIIVQIPLDDARIILVGDDANHRCEFQIEHKDTRWTLSSNEHDLIQATKTRNAWFQEVKQINREFQKRKFLGSPATSKTNLHA